MKINKKKLIQMRVKEPIKSYVSTSDNKLYLYGDIGDYWDGVTLDKLQLTTRSMDKSEVTIHINSYGGDATEGVAIRNYLRSTFAHIDVVIDGIAASAASVIATCGDTLTMPVGTTYMIHNPWTVAFGNRQDLLKEVGALESLEKSYRNIYMDKFAGTEEELMELLDNESWLTAEEAEQLGFATKVAESDVEEPIVIEANLVASLINKYAAKAKPDDKSDDTDPEDKKEDNDTDIIENELKKDEPKPNNLLQNFAKVFSNFE